MVPVLCYRVRLPSSFLFFLIEPPQLFTSLTLFLPPSPCSPPPFGPPCTPSCLLLCPSFLLPLPFLPLPPLLVSCVNPATDIAHVPFMCIVSNKSSRVFTACCISIRDYIQKTFGKDVNIASFVHDMVLSEGTAFIQVFNLHPDTQTLCEFHVDGALHKKFVSAMKRDGWADAEIVKAWSHLFLIIEVLEKHVRYSLLPSFSLPPFPPLSHPTSLIPHFPPLVTLHPIPHSPPLIFLKPLTPPLFLSTSPPSFHLTSVLPHCPFFPTLPYLSPKYLTYLLTKYPLIVLGWSSSGLHGEVLFHSCPPWCENPQ
jgi:hypothetical protein